MEADKFKELFADFLTTDGSDNYQGLTEERVNEILNMFELLFRWGETPPKKEEEAFIEGRIGDLINEVTLDNMPSWFMYLLTISASVPLFAEKLLEVKVEELLQTLSD